MHNAYFWPSQTRQHLRDSGVTHNRSWWDHRWDYYQSLYHVSGSSTTQDGLQLVLRCSWIGKFDEFQEFQHLPQLFSEGWLRTSQRRLKVLASIGTSCLETLSDSKDRTLGDRHLPSLFIMYFLNVHEITSSLLSCAGSSKDVNDLKLIISGIYWPKNLGHMVSIQANFRRPK